MKLLEELKWRGLVYDIINEEELEKRLEEKPITLYCGFDPTADSLHMGSLLPIVTLMRFKNAGHRIIALTGGATGMIGDPSGKKAERQLNELETIKIWSDNFKSQFSKFIAFDNINSFSLDNYDWLSKISILELWRDFGKHFGINYMLAKDSVKSRLESGISYSEFSYMIMQSIDFLKMFQNPELKCEMQIGGQDQWGNITAGMELIRKVEGSDVKVYGLTMPLITKADGTKYGKTESGSVWLDESKTSAYEMYQFLINTPDADVIKLLKFFTFLGVNEITELEESIVKEAHLRKAQKALAKEVVTMVHGEKGLQEAIKVTEALFSGDIKQLNAREIEIGFKGLNSIILSTECGLIEALVESKLASSKREAREFIQNGAVSINGDVEKDTLFILKQENAIEGKFTILRRGKKNYALIVHQ
jgi:tyrosyl-tRNA synthetase